MGLIDIQQLRVGRVCDCSPSRQIKTIDRISNWWTCGVFGGGQTTRHDQLPGGVLGEYTNMPHVVVTPPAATPVPGLPDVSRAVQVALSTKVNRKDWPGDCDVCGRPAYVSALSIECSAKCCKERS